MGALFGLVRGGVLLLVVAVIVGLTPLRDEAWWKESLGAYVLTQVLESLRPALPQNSEVFFLRGISDCLCGRL